MKKLVALFAALGLVFAACGDDSSSDSSGSPDSADSSDDTGGSDSSGGSDAITIANFAFEAPESVAVGTTVEVTNTDGATHTLSATDGSFDTGNLGADASATVTFETAGTVEFMCKIHPSMTGSITVEG
jgi:plastocyanin